MYQENKNLPVSPPPELSPQNDLNLEQATKLLIQSFHHSQGFVLLQLEIWEYIHYLHPQWRIDNHMLEDIKTQGKKTLEKLFQISPETLTSQSTFHISLKRKEMYAEFDSEAEDMQKELARTDKDIEPSKLVSKIATGIIEKDYEYLKKGRPHKHARNKNKYFSYLCFYALEAHSTGMSDLDKMYKDVVQVLEQSDTTMRHNENYDPKLIEIINQYYSNGSHSMPSQAINLLKTLTSRN